MKKRKSRVVDIELADKDVVNIESIDKLRNLQKPKETMWETPNYFLLLRQDVVFRVLKATVRPKIVSAKNVCLNTDFSARVEISPEDLLKIGLSHDLAIFEAEDQLLILGDSILLCAKKAVKNDGKQF